MFSFIQKHKLFFLYGISLAVLLLLLQLLEFRFLILSHGFEIYAGALAVIFTLLGIWLAKKLTEPKTVIVEKEVFVQNENFIRNEKAIKELELSSRELEVLELMSRGLSNAEIGKELFLSENTIKTHSSNLFFKLDVKRRTQAVEKARRMGVIG
jgi:NarL family two-component system response regulator LiaR